MPMIQQFHCPPPVLFDELMKLELSPELRSGIYELLEIKKVSDEKERGEKIPLLNEFIVSELVRQKEYTEGIADDRPYGWEPLNEIFLKVLE